MHKLTNIEAQRVLAVLQDGIDGLTHLSYIPTRPELQVFDHLSTYGYTELAAFVQKEWQLEDNITSLAAAAVHSSGSHHANKAMSIVNTEEIHQQLYSTARNVVREMRRAPEAIKILQGVFQEERSQEFVTFLHKLSEMKGVMFRRLATTVEEDLRNSSMLRELTEKRKNAQDELEMLKRNLANEKKDKEKETSALEKVLTKLQSELRDLTQNTNLEMQSIQTEMRGQVDKSTKDYTGRKADLQTQVNNLVPEMAKAAEEHKQTEALLRKRRTKVETELAAVIAQYDQSMRAKRDEFEQLVRTMDVEQKELKELQEYFDRVEGNAGQIRMEERIIEEVRRREQAALAQMNRGAAMLQAVFRGRKARQEYQKIKAKAKKGKKKGGKGKGKKK